MNSYSNTVLRAQFVNKLFEKTRDGKIEWKYEQIQPGRYRYMSKVVLDDKAFLFCLEDEVYTASNYQGRMGLILKCYLENSLVSEIITANEIKGIYVVNPLEALWKQAGSPLETQGNNAIFSEALEGLEKI